MLQQWGPRDPLAQTWPQWEVHRKSASGPLGLAWRGGAFFADRFCVLTWLVESAWTV